VLLLVQQWLHAPVAAGLRLLVVAVAGCCAPAAAERNMWLRLILS
jgi:hypothetical protein